MTQQPSTPTTPEPARLNVLAGVCAFLFPGLGHVVRGERLRGVLAGASVLYLFFAGVLIGGIDVVDSREDKVWFIGEGLVGPLAFGTDWVHQNQFKAYGHPTATGSGNAVALRSGQPDETRVHLDVDVPAEKDRTGRVVKPAHTEKRWVWRRLTPDELHAGKLGPPNRKSVAKDNEIGTLYATLAGMVNFIVILDALIVTPRRRRRHHGGTPAEGGAHA